MTDKAFYPFAFKHGKLHDCDSHFPSTLAAWTEVEALSLGGEGTHFLFVFEGMARLECASGAFHLRPGMYAAVPREGRITGGRGIVVTRVGHYGVFLLGGPIEDEGRLKYIDGCTDSLLIPPVKLGDPCLNHLHFPGGIDQTMHTHPSARVGMVCRGRGECVTPDGVYALEPGVIFSISTDGHHKFRTKPGQGMDVIAYHPDSDYGPTDERHPMINRTMVDGVSASYIAAIRTR